MNNTLGIIGSGSLGGAVARLAVDAGMDVVLSNSRGPETLRDLTADLGPRARAATMAEAVHTGSRHEAVRLWSLRLSGICRAVSRIPGRRP
jgi:lactate dehydrogenase-like 2-hydroxyacid dehydrogenase